MQVFVILPADIFLFIINFVDFVNESRVGMNVHQLVHCCGLQAASSFVLHKSKQAPISLCVAGSCCLTQYSNSKALQLRHGCPEIKPPLIRWHCASCCLRNRPAKNAMTTSELRQLICKQHLFLGIREHFLNQLVEAIHHFL